jgi:hypothetical protein
MTKGITEKPKLRVKIYDQCACGCGEPLIGEKTTFVHHGPHVFLIIRQLDPNPHRKKFDSLAHPNPSQAR